MDGDAALASWIARVRSLATLNAEAARIAAPLVEAAAKASAAAGTTPEGEPWQARAKGGRALPDAAGAVTARARGTVVQIVLSGVYVLHHLSKGGHNPRRTIIPHRGGAIPPAIARAVNEGARRAFLRAMGGR